MILDESNLIFQKGPRSMGFMAGISRNRQGINDKMVSYETINSDSVGLGNMVQDLEGNYIRIIIFGVLYLG